MPGAMDRLGTRPGSGLLAGVRRWPPWLQNLGLSLASVSVLTGVLLATELLVRLGAPSGAAGADSVYDGHLYSERLGWVPRPGAVFDVGGARTTINALGYRGRLVRPEDTQHPKVVVLGDSVAFGYGVRDDETFSALLDDSLPEMDVVNLAVPGYGIDQSLLRFEADGRQYRPSIVLLNVCIANDLADVMLATFLYDNLHPKPFFTLAEGQLVLHDEHVRLGLFDTIGLKLRERSHAYRRLRAHMAAPAPAEPEPEVDWVGRRRDALRDPAPARALIAALIARLRADVARQGGRLIVVVHPTKEAYRLSRSWIDDVGLPPASDGLRTVDLGTSYHAAGLGFGSVALDWLGHLNPAGHRLAAEALQAEVTRTDSSTTPARP